MDYRRYGDAIYIRLDRGDEIITCILDICHKEKIRSATYSGIGGCKEARIKTFIPETGTFEAQTLQDTGFCDFGSGFFMIKPWDIPCPIPKIIAFAHFMSCFSQEICRILRL